MPTRIAIVTDTEGILDLQSQNLYINLPPTAQGDGFIITAFTPEQMQSLIVQRGVFVAVQDGEIGGYLCAGNWDFFSRWEIFAFLASRLPLIAFHGIRLDRDHTFQYGPVCIDRAWRGSGVLLDLFTTMQSSLAPRFPIGVTFINRRNPRSLAAHTHKLKFEIVDEFEFKGSEYYALAFYSNNHLQRGKE